MIKYEFEMIGEIVGKARPRMNTRTGKAYTPTNTKNYEYFLRQWFIREYPNFKPIETRVKVTIVAYFSIPKSTSKKKEAEILINAVAEQYPELKSNENYKTLMTELAITENIIAEHRNNYNIQIKQYNKHIKKFPNSAILNIMGYEKLENTYLEYEASEDVPKNLFKE